jgi:hypothetical protein
MPDRAPFPTFVAVDVFSELFGFVLLSPDDLDAHHAGQARRRDLLHELTSTDEGDRVAAEGIAVPVLGVPADDYTLVVRHVDVASTLTDVAFESRGWVLHATATPLCLCGLGYRVGTPTTRACSDLESRRAGTWSRFAVERTRREHERSSSCSNHARSDRRFEETRRSCSTSRSEHVSARALRVWTTMRESTARGRRGMTLRSRAGSLVRGSSVRAGRYVQQAGLRIEDQRWSNDGGLLRSRLRRAQ